MNFLMHAVDQILTNKFYLWGLILICFLVFFLFLGRIFVGLKSHNLIKESLRTLFRNTGFDIYLPLQKQLVFWGRENIFIRPVFEAVEIVGATKNWNRNLLLFIGIHSFLLLWGQAFFSSLFLALVLVLASMSLIVFYIFYKSNQVRDKMVEQIPMFLSALSNALEAGYSLPNAFIFIEPEVPQPLQEEIQKISQKLNLQIPLDKALFDFAHGVQQKDILFFAESTVIQMRIGGNLIELFQRVSRIIETRLKLERDLRSFTSQGKMSGIMIAGLFPISLLFFHWLSPSHVAVLFETEAGRLLLGIALMLELIGFWSIWKIINIKI